MGWDGALTQKIRYEPYVHIYLYRYYIIPAFAIEGYREIEPIF